MTRKFTVDQLPVEIHDSARHMGVAAAEYAAEILKQAITERGAARAILATGNSQLPFLEALRDIDGIDWSRVTVFHMDEYLGIDPDNPASFPLFLHQHFFKYVTVGTFHPVPGQPEDVQAACDDYASLLREAPIDLVAMGFGENGHLAFNDPPYADFDDPYWVKVVKLDPVSRQQQVGEGHFPDLAAVPEEAITLTIPALLSPAHILCMVPEARKANAVLACLQQPVSDQRPGSILRTVSHARLYLDPESAQHLD